MTAKNVRAPDQVFDAILASDAEDAADALADAEARRIDALSEAALDEELARDGLDPARLRGPRPGLSRRAPPARVRRLPLRKALLLVAVLVAVGLLLSALGGGVIGRGQRRAPSPTSSSRSSGVTVMPMVASGSRMSRMTTSRAT
jgi:anti-sigma factor RsiW